MARRLSKEESRVRFGEGRALWNAFDPIGVSDAVNDEYDSYVGASLRIAEAGKPSAELADYVRWVVFVQMGMNQTDSLSGAIDEFAQKFQEWYRVNWTDTIV